MYFSSVNTCQNQVKLSTLKVQDDVQLAIAKFCLSIKDCRSQASFKSFWLLKDFQAGFLLGFFQGGTASIISVFQYYSTIKTYCKIHGID